MRVIQRYRMPDNPTPDRIAVHLPELMGDTTKQVLLDLEGELIVVTQEVTPDFPPDQFTMTVEEAVQNAVISELENRGATFLETVHNAVKQLQSQTLTPTQFLVGDRALFFSCLGLYETDSFMGIPVTVVEEYPENKATVAGSRTPFAPIAGITQSICFEVSI